MLVTVFITFQLDSRLIAASSEENLFVTFEIPVSYSFKQATDGSSLETDGLPSGLLLSIKFPSTGFGVGLNSYEIKTTQSTSSSIRTMMIDLFYSVYFSVFNMALGYGYGNSELIGEYSNSYEKSPCSKYYLRLGIPFGSDYSVDMSIHNISSQIKVKESDYKLEAGGTMSSIGISVGF